MNKFALGLGVTLLTTSAARADEAATVAARQDTCTQLALSLAAQLTSAIGESRDSDTLIVVREVLEPGAPDVPGLRACLFESLAAHVGFGVTLSYERARAENNTWLRDGYDALAQVNVRTEGNMLLLDGSVAVSTPGWRGLLARAALPAGTLSLRQRIDASLRRYLGGPAPRVGSSVRVTTLPLPSDQVLALAACDLDLDGKDEVLVIDRRQIVWLAITPTASGGFELTQLDRTTINLPRSPIPARAPTAIVTVTPSGIAIQTTDHVGAVSVSVSDDGRLVSTPRQSSCPAPSLEYHGGCLARTVGSATFVESGGPTRGPDRQGRRGIYLAQTVTYLDPMGASREAELSVDDSGALLVRHQGSARIEARANVGAQLAVDDMEADGVLELLATSSAEAPASDTLSLLRLGEQDASEVWRSTATAGPITAVASVDLNGDGLREFVAVEEPMSNGIRNPRLWVIY